jgi:hypothetical protein
MGSCFLRNDIFRGSLKNKAKELGVDLVSVWNLRDYKSPRSPIPLRHFASAKSIVVLAFKPLAGPVKK